VVRILIELTSRPDHQNGCASDYWISWHQFPFDRRLRKAFEVAAVGLGRDLDTKLSLHSFGLNETFFRCDETLPKQKGSIIAPVCRLFLEGVTMFEFVIAVAVLSSVAIFFAHAVETFLTR